MLQIDDAGSGSFVGGTCIGLYRPESREYYFDIIPVELYNRENFKKKLYLDAVINIVSAGMEALEASPGETIELCRGYMFDNLKKWLSGKSYFWYTTQISGDAQEIIEKSFEIYTKELGLPESYIKYTEYPFHFHKLLRWVLADYENRIRLCKVGWKSWQKIEGINVETTWGNMQNSNMSCLKCGKHINRGERIKILKFTSNRENYIYVHQNC